MLESLTFFGDSVEYSGVFRRFWNNLRSFHYGVTMEFSVLCDIYYHRGINANSLLSVEKVRRSV